jgi:hypothetical protein
MLAAIGSLLGQHGLILRGGFRPGVEERGLGGVATVVLVGNAGPAMWEAFASRVDGETNPLNRWTRGVVNPIAEQFGARAIYPFDPDLYPFQRWALRSEPVHGSPLGILIHPEYGLWHAYRAALLFADLIDLPARAVAPSPCASCADKLCLSACPVGAFGEGAYDVAACAGHIAKPDSECPALGCRARDACPVGTVWRYPKEQIRFHMAAFRRSVAPS